MVNTFIKGKEQKLEKNEFAVFERNEMKIHLIIKSSYFGSNALHSIAVSKILLYQKSTDVQGCYNRVCYNQVCYNLVCYN
jgi:hypothetical protein